VGNVELVCLAEPNKGGLGGGVKGVILSRSTNGGWRMESTSLNVLASLDRDLKRIPYGAPGVNGKGKTQTGGEGANP